MKIRKREILDNYVVEHADSRAAIQRWLDIVEEAEWKSHIDLKNSFPSADYIGNERYVFNVKGNKYRIIVVVIFIAGLISIDFVGTHAEYDKLKF